MHLQTYFLLRVEKFEKKILVSFFNREKFELKSAIAIFSTTLIQLFLIKISFRNLQLEFGNPNLIVRIFFVN